MVQPGLVAIEEGEGRMLSSQGFEGERQAGALLDLVPVSGDAVALSFDFQTEEAGLNVGEAGDSPVGRGELANQVGFGLAGRSEVAEVFLQLSFVFRFGLAGQDHGFGREPMLYGVERDGAAALLGFGAARFGSIDSGGFGLGRCHSCVPGESVAGGIREEIGDSEQVVGGEEDRVERDL